MHSQLQLVRRCITWSMAAFRTSAPGAVHCLQGCCIICACCIQLAAEGAEVLLRRPGRVAPRNHPCATRDRYDAPVVGVPVAALDVVLQQICRVVRRHRCSVHNLKVMKGKTRLAWRTRHAPSAAMLCSPLHDQTAAFCHVLQMCDDTRRAADLCSCLASLHSWRSCSNIMGDVPMRSTAQDTVIHSRCWQDLSAMAVLELDAPAM